MHRVHFVDVSGAVMKINETTCCRAFVEFGSWRRGNDKLNARKRRRRWW
jgi:hypothetical protein